MPTEKKSPAFDSDVRKGAFESEEPRTTPNSGSTPDSLSNQLGHRDSDPMLKDYDSDYPEPDSSGEHSGQKERH
jgi:hypothetical protein